MSGVDRRDVKVVAVAGMAVPVLDELMRALEDAARYEEADAVRPVRRLANELADVRNLRS